MTETQSILQKIAALRQRLSQATGRVASATVADPVQHLAEKVASGTQQTALLEETFRPLAVIPERAPPLPRRLTARGARLLQKSRDLVWELRHIGEDPFFQAEGRDALVVYYHQTVAMLDSVLRAVTNFPDLPSAQIKQCEGLEAILAVVEGRLGLFQSALPWKRRSLDQMHRLRDFLTAIVAGQCPPWELFRILADELLDEARHEYPLRFLSAPASDPVAFVASHGLVVAQVMARLLCHDPEWRHRVHEPVVAGLLHDVGMVTVPADILDQQGALRDEQRRRVEYHTREGGELLAPLAVGAPWLVEAATCHHERSDGTGYPAGLVELHLSPLVRLLSICDIYAALCSPRPYRSALEPRTALTDTLLLADQGAIDRFQAERLVQLSFFPVGSVVELSDGATGLVTAVQGGPGDRFDPARPQVVVLADGQGRLQPFPRQVDLARAGINILRILPDTKRSELLAAHFPALG